MKMNLNQLCQAHGLPSAEPVGGPRCFKIIRFRQSGNKRVIRNNVTEAEAQAHCSREDTRGPGWFDGYDYMPGCRPKG